MLKERRCTYLSVRPRPSVEREGELEGEMTEAETKRGRRTEGEEEGETGRRADENIFSV